MSRLRGFGPAGLLAMVVIPFSGTAVIGAILVLVWARLTHTPWRDLGFVAPRNVSYAEVANWVGPLTQARMVAGACAANSIALAIPCHRVVRSNGDLGGYRWGVERKREMIRRESMA